MNTKINPEELKAFLAKCSPDTKIYIGADSEKVKVAGKWYADYMLAVVVHVNGNNGCRIFGEISRELDFDKNKDKPVMRLMNEVYKVAELHERLADILIDHQVEIHLDLNPKKRYASNLVVQQAIGYIKGTVGIEPMIKPNSPAASYASDQLKQILQIQRKYKKEGEDVVLVPAS